MTWDIAEYFVMAEKRREKELEEAGLEDIGLLGAIAVLDRWEASGWEIKQAMSGDGGIDYWVEDQPGESAIRVYMF